MNDLAEGGRDERRADRPASRACQDLDEGRLGEEQGRREEEGARLEEAEVLQGKEARPRHEANPVAAARRQCLGDLALRAVQGHRRVLEAAQRRRRRRDIGAVRHAGSGAFSAAYLPVPRRVRRSPAYHRRVPAATARPRRSDHDGAISAAWAPPARSGHREGRHPGTATRTGLRT
ncbi:hypothetical protein ACRAWF_28140 [Streptomyces sp. L7]